MLKVSTFRGTKFVPSKEYRALRAEYRLMSLRAFFCTVIITFNVR